MSLYRIRVPQHIFLLVWLHFRSAAPLSGIVPSFSLNIDNARTLSSTGSISYPPMVSVPGSILGSTQSTAKEIEIVKPPNVEALYDWYVSTRNTPNADPSWAVVWPTAISLSNYLLAHPEVVQNKRVIEMGAGLGICGLTAALLGARSVLLTDREPFALHCALASATCNRLDQVTGALLDWCSGDDETLEDENYNVILASDVLYDADGVQALATACNRFASPGGLVLVSDPKVERFAGARQTFRQTLAATNLQILDLAPIPQGSGASSFDARDHVRRMQESTVLVQCKF